MAAFLSDSEEQLDGMIKTAKEHGADFVLVGGLTLFGSGASDCRTLYYKVLEKHYPELIPKCWRAIISCLRFYPFKGMDNPCVSVSSVPIRVLCPKTLMSHKAQARKYEKVVGCVLFWYG